MENKKKLLAEMIEGGELLHSKKIFLFLLNVFFLLFSKSWNKRQCSWIRDGPLTDFAQSNHSGA